MRPPETLTGGRQKQQSDHDHQCESSPSPYRHAFPRSIAESPIPAMCHHQPSIVQPQHRTLEKTPRPRSLATMRGFHSSLSPQSPPYAPRLYSPPPPHAVEDEGVGVPDLTDLGEDLCEDSILNNLHQRYKRDLVFTNLGDMLISLNPFCPLNLFSSAAMRAYHGYPPADLPPHIFGVLEQAFQSVLDHTASYCVLVTGETGSGKSEVIKQALTYLCRVASLEDRQHQMPSLAHRILRANVVLEAFGNARTPRNDNATRCVKHWTIDFDHQGNPSGASVCKYMLEKSRVTHRDRGIGQKNFHIFYHLLCGADPCLAKSLKLSRNVEDYALLRSGDAPHTHCDSPKAQRPDTFHHVKDALCGLGFCSVDLDSLWALLAAVLKLGNIQFLPVNHIDGIEGCTPASEYELREVADLLCAEYEDLLCALTQRIMWTEPPPPSLATAHASGGPTPPSTLRRDHCSSQHLPTRPTKGPCAASVRDFCEVSCDTPPAPFYRDCPSGLDYATPSSRSSSEIATVDLSAAEAANTRDQLCGAIYNRIFTWLVAQISLHLKNDHGFHRCQLSLVDMFGFEVFERNDLEQMAINFCNERVHQFILEHTIRGEQEEYIREGIDWECVEFRTNETVCQLLEAVNHGIFSVLDEESLRGGHVTGDTLLLRLTQACAGHPSFETRGMRNFLSDDSLPQSQFRIRHFAGNVLYDPALFIEKNQDFLPLDVSHAMYHCDQPLLKTLFPEGNPKRPALKRPASFTSQVRTSVSALVKTLSLARPVFVRCIRPNELGLPRKFETALVRHQIRYMSLTESALVRRDGFSFCMGYEAFLNRFKMLSVHTWPSWTRGCPQDGVLCLLRDLGIPTKECSFGRTKIFIKGRKLVAELECFRAQRIHDLACLIQRTWRMWHVRRAFLKMLVAQIRISSVWRGWRVRARLRAFHDKQTVEWAVRVIQRWYFMAVKKRWLLNLSSNLPSTSPLSSDWPPCPRRLRDSSLLLRSLHHKWRCAKYRRQFDQTSRNRLREKVTASILFRGRKASYDRSVGHPFVGDYVHLRQNPQWKKLCAETNDQYVVFADIVNKVNRSSGRFVPVLMALSTSGMLILDQRTMLVKQRIPATEVYRLSLSPLFDDLCLVHIRAKSPTSDLSEQLSMHVVEPGTCILGSEGKRKGDFAFQTPHVIEVTTKLFLVIQNATGKAPEVHIDTQFDANFGSQTVTFAYKAGAITEVLPGQIKIARRGNRMDILL
ncbi:unnamed protein product [Cyprideis torosa]|uniref:Uncharacterized protein n=1 Tax=Cyprideis torosa TaxID=163714 RepID=A0A7R8ZQG2_9CRUS|nr:unnamed protein product [Cyprideis torosa]CAG0890612.1 unnamed protein product [Cyprideis torosa]